MSKKIQIDIEVNGKMTKATVDAKQLRTQLDGVDTSQKKTTKSGEKFQKGLKGIGEQSANASKNFSKFSAGMGGFVGVYAALAAQLFAISAAFQFLKRAGDLDALKQGQVAYASATGIAMRSLAADIQNATNSQITFQDAAQAGAIGVAAGLSADQLTRLGSAAADASQILGRDVTDSFNRLVRGVTKAEPELLDELGIILRLKDATEEYARQLNLDAQSLTQFQKSQAVANDVLGQAEEKYSRILEVVGRTPNEFGQLGVAFDNVINDIKEIISSVAGPLATVLTDTPALAGAAFALLLSGPLKAIGFSFQDIASGAEDSATRQVKALEKIKVKQKELSNTVAARKTDLEKLAVKEVGQGTSSKILKSLAKGGKLYGVDKANLRKALKAAEDQLKEHGQITKGIFVGRDQEILNSFKTTLDRMDEATVQTVSRWQRANLTMRSVWARTVATIQGGIAAITRAFSFVIRIAGYIGILTVAYKSIKQALQQEVVPTDAERQLQKTQKAAEMAQQKINSLAEEYKNFAAVQQVNFKFADTELSVIHGSAQALANMLATTFNPKNLPTFISNLQGMAPKIKEIRKNTAQLNREVNYLLETGGGKFVGALFSILGIFKGQEGAQKALKATTEAVVSLGYKAEEALGFEVPELQLPESILKSEEVLNNAADSLTDFSARLAEMGIKDYKVFKNFTADIKLLREVAAETTQLTEEQAIALAERLANGSKAAADLAGNLASLTELSKATAQAFSAVENAILGLSAGDQLRRAAQEQIKTIKAVAKAADRTLTPEEADQVTKLNYQRTLGIAIAENDNRIKIGSLRLQAESARNSLRFRKSQNSILQQSDKIAKLESDINNSHVLRERLITFSMKEYGKITPEAQRQLSLLNTTLTRDEARLRVAKDLLAIRQRDSEFVNNIEDSQVEQKIISNATQIVSALQKELSIRKEIFALQDASAKRAIEKRERGDPRFADTERKSAEMAFKLEKGMLPQKIAFVNREYELKLQMIDFEYDLLEAKKIQTANELKAEAIRLRRARKDGSEDPQALEMQRLAVRVEGQDFSAARDAAKALAQTVKEDSIAGLLNNADKLKFAAEQFEGMNRIAESLETTIGDGLTSAISDVITGTQNMKEAFLSMGQMIMRVLAQLIAEMIAMKILQTIIGMAPVSSAKATQISSFKPSGIESSAIEYSAPLFGDPGRYGGIFSNGVKEYATGGIAKGPQAGYPATLHGTEAVVPLPNGRSIPVNMNGGGQQNNVVVNVSVDNQGNASQDSQADNNSTQRLGVMIAGAVQKELHNQKRAGGILNPMGAS